MKEVRYCSGVGTSLPSKDRDISGCGKLEGEKGDCGFADFEGIRGVPGGVVVVGVFYLRCFVSFGTGTGIYLLLSHALKWLLRCVGGLVLRPGLMNGDIDETKFAY